MAQYQLAGIDANVGYETGTPAYPDPVEDAPHQLPLTLAELSTIINVTQSKYKGAIIWELFKLPAKAGEASATDVARAVCRTVLPGDARCAGALLPAP